MLPGHATLNRWWRVLVFLCGLVCRCFSLACRGASTGAVVGVCGVRVSAGTPASIADGPRAHRAAAVEVAGTAAAGLLGSMLLCSSRVWDQTGMLLLCTPAAMTRWRRRWRPQGRPGAGRSTVAPAAASQGGGGGTAAATIASTAAAVALLGAFMAHVVTATASRVVVWAAAVAR